MSRWSLLAFVHLVLVFAPGSGRAASYYVDGTNSNDANAGTLSQPWRSVGKANTALQPGDTVYLMEGINREAIRPARSGTSGNPITYASYDASHKATVDGVYDGADLQNRSYIALDGLQITNTRHFWVNMHNASSHDIVRNCYMRKTDAWAGTGVRWDSAIVGITTGCHG